MDVMNASRGSLQERIMGVIMLKAPVYREIADDVSATPQALTVFVAATVIAKFFSGLVSTSGGATSVSIGGAIVSVIVGVLVGLLALYFTGWVLATVANRFFGGKTNTSEMVRVTGFVSVFSVVSVLNILLFISPALGCLTGILSLAVAVLSIVGYTIGVREAAEFSTTNAIITAVIAAVVNFIIVVVIAGGIIGLFAGLFAIAGQ
jgi:hypothetical protein